MMAKGATPCGRHGAGGMTTTHLLGDVLDAVDRRGLAPDDAVAVRAASECALAVSLHNGEEEGVGSSGVGASRR